MAAVAEMLPLEVETKTDTFSISVKNDEKEVIYENKEEPYDYHVIPSLSTALEYFGAKMSEDQKAFLTEALRGDTTGPAVAKVIRSEPYDYHVIPSLSTALEYFGAKMSEDQKAFLTEALRGDTTGPAVAKVIE